MSTIETINELDVECPVEENVVKTVAAHGEEEVEEGDEIADEGFSKIIQNTMFDVGIRIESFRDGEGLKATGGVGGCIGNDGLSFNKSITTSHRLGHPLYRLRHRSRIHLLGIRDCRPSPQIDTRWRLSRKSRKFPIHFHRHSPRLDIVHCHSIMMQPHKLLIVFSNQRRQMPFTHTLQQRHIPRLHRFCHRCKHQLHLSIQLHQQCFQRHMRRQPPNRPLTQL